MSSITIRDLARNQALDRQALGAIRGGNASLKGLGGLGGLGPSGPFANVNVAINQNISQLQNIDVNVLNNVGMIGAGFVPPKVDVSPAQWANAGVAV